MELIQLSPWDLSIAALLVLVLAVISWRLHLGIERQLLIATVRSVLQLMLIGLVLKTLFAQSNPLLIGAVTLFMLGMAGYEVMARQQRRFKGLWGMGIGTLSMFISSFSITLLALHVVVQVEPWYAPQYLIPLLGMLLGNTMTGMAIALDNLTQQVWQRRGAIEVSLPGMMTGQILAGGPPMEAAKYQIMILMLIAGGTGLGATFAVWLGSRRLFDQRERLRLDRLR